MISKEQDNSRQRLKRTSARDIGNLPACQDPINRVMCDQSLLYFLKHCFPQRFYNEFGKAHLDYIKALQDIIENGGLQSIGFARSGGKSTIAQLAVLWAAVTGRRSYSLFVALSAKKAKEANQAIYKALQTNDRLLQLYPQACYPIRCLQGSAGRARGQLYRGRPTGLEFGKKIVLAAVGGISDNCVININSISSGIRGQAAVRADGTYIRPSLVIIDDIVADKTAGSPQVQQGLQDIIQNSIMFLAGVGVSISICFIGTILNKYDVCAKYLDIKKKPAWRGIKMPALYSMPTNMDLWQKYREILNEDYENGNQLLSNQFYLLNRQKMDEGAVSSWQYRKQPKDISAIQHAMKKWATNPSSFFSQYQLNPQEKELVTGQLKVQDINTNISSLPRGVRPSQPHKICIGIDINEPALTWVVCAYTAQKVYIIDYGTTPESPTRYFSLKDFKNPMIRRFPATSIDESARLALDWLMNDLTQKYTPDIVLVDRGYHVSIQPVASICEKWKIKTGNIYLSALGRAHGARSTANYADTKTQKGQVVDVSGLWKLYTKAQYGAYVIHQTDMNKDKVSQLFKNNRIEIYDPKDNGNHHKLFFEHCVSQYPVRVQVLDDYKNVWQKDKKYNQQDHYWDCLLLTNIGASLIGHKVFKSFTKKKETATVANITKQKRSAIKFKY